MLVIFINILEKKSQKFFLQKTVGQGHLPKKFFSKNNFLENDAPFFYIRNYLISNHIYIFTKVIKPLKIEIEKLTSNFSLPT